MSPSADTIAMETTDVQALEEQATKAEAAKARRPREEIPEFEDPSAELEKCPTDLVKPDRTKIDDKIYKLQSVIDGHKVKIATLTKSLDRIKEDNQKRKAQGSGEMERARAVIRDIKSRLVATIEEKKKITATIEQLRSSERAVKEQLKAAQSSVGSLKTNEAIDDEITRIQDQLHHQTNTLKEEKAMMIRIKELEACRSSVKQLETLQATAKTTQVTGVQELYDARRAKDEILDGLKEEETAAVAVLEDLRTKRDKEIASNNFSELFTSATRCATR
jgi:archaellum component FlaC